MFFLVTMLEHKTISRASWAGESHWIMKELGAPSRNGNRMPVSFISIYCWHASEMLGG
jgi:hypothetical protein